MGLGEDGEYPPLHTLHSNVMQSVPHPLSVSTTHVKVWRVGAVLVSTASGTVILSNAALVVRR